MSNTHAGFTASRRAALALVLVVCAIALSATTAGAYSTAGGYVAHDFATGFPTSPSVPWAPIGVAFDQSDNLYVVDAADGNIYRFGLDGGTASSDTRITPNALPGAPLGIAVGPDGRLYVARHDAGDVIEVDPASGGYVRTVAGGIPDATAIVVDPVSHDLFVSQNLGGDKIFRISHYESGPGLVSTYSSGNCCVDGLTFGNDGTLYASAGGRILAIGGTSSSSPGATTQIAQVPNSDGMGFAPVDSSGTPAYLVVNRTDGTVTRVDLGHAGSTSDIFSGGSRGDLVAVDSRGCLYVTQSDSVVKIAPAHGSCGLVPTTVGTAPGAGLALETVHAVGGAKGAHTVCRVMRRLTVRVRQRGRVRLASAAVYVNGRLVRRLGRRRATAPVTLTRLPSGAITIRIVARTTGGRHLRVTRRYANCSDKRAVKHTKTKKQRKKGTVRSRSGERRG